MIKYILICILFLHAGWQQCLAQPLLENLSGGLYGRSETNMYRYYSNKGIGNFNTIRVSNGYSAGVHLHTSVNYLFNIGASFGLSEASYKPDIEKNGSILWSNQMRLWHVDVWGELKLSQSETHMPVLILGGQWMVVEYKRELYNQIGDARDYAWPHVRLMPKIGLGYHASVGKRWSFTPNIGLRIATQNKVGYDYVINQFCAGINMAYRFKSW